MNPSREATSETPALQYCPRLAETVRRRQMLFEGRGRDRIFATFNLNRPSPALAEFNRTHKEGECGYPDPAERLAFWDAYLRERAGIEDDSVPSAYLNEWDMGLAGALVGGQMRFFCHPWGRISSQVPPFMDGWQGLDVLWFDREHPWFQAYLEQMRILAAGAAGKFGLAPHCQISHLHLPMEMLGTTRMFEEVVDNPGQVARAVELAHEITCGTMDAFFHEVPLLAGGTCLAWNQWVPGRIVMESVDAFHLASVDYFERWGRKALERIFATYDGGILHIHGNGRHLLEAVSTIRGLKLIDMADDQPGVPYSFDILPEIRRRTGDVPLIVHAEFNGFRKALQERRLLEGILYNVGGAPDADAANRCMDDVRAYRA